MYMYSVMIHADYIYIYVYISIYTDNYRIYIYICADYINIQTRLAAKYELSGILII